MNTTAVVSGIVTWCKVCGNLRTDGQPHCHANHEREAMKLTKSTNPITTSNGREKQPNPFLEADTLAALMTGDTFHILFGKGDKPTTIVNQLREAAKLNGKGVSIRHDGDVKKVTEAKGIRVAFGTRRERKTETATAAE